MKLSVLAMFFALSIGHAWAQRIAPDILPTGKGPLTIQPIQHASLVLTINKKTIYADPSGSAALYQGIDAPDMIVITDIHGDHFDTATLRAILRPNTILVVPPAVADKLPASEKANLVILKNGDQAVKMGVTIRAIPMYNLPETADSKHPKGRGNGYVLTIGGKNIYLSGDTQGIPEMRALKNIDLAFVCMNLPYTMDVPEAADAVLAFKPAIVYPYHYRGQNGFSDTNAFKKLVDAGNKGIEVRLRNWYAAGR
ncbi:MAG: MBL fold metallo-hydrolase [Puia sp.]|nr:MBL fold metallo-hydrolase [Puia sp.]